MSLPEPDMTEEGPSEKRNGEPDGTLKRRDMRGGVTPIPRKCEFAPLPPPPPL